MKLFLKNKVYAYLSLSRIFNTLGSSIYNIVFVIFASSMPQPKFAVALANFIVLVPTFFTLFVGIQSDRTSQKARWLIYLGYVQALLFVLVALLSRSSTYLAFSCVCLINILSDIISDYRGGLQMPILKKHIAEEEMMEAFSFTQFICFACNLAGQALGVWILTASQQNFTLVALINALTFLLSSSILYLVRRQLTHEKVQKTEKSLPLSQQLREIYRSAKLIFEGDGTSNFLRMLTQILMINALAGSLSALYNIYLLDQPLFSLSFGQSLLLFQVLLMLGIAAASLTPKDYFSRLSLNQLTFWAIVTILLLGISNLLQLPVFIGMLVCFFLAYISGKINPKVSAMLLSKLPSDVLAQTSSFLNLLFSFSVPLGTMIFTSLALWNMTAAWLVFTAIGAAALILALRKRTEQ